MKTYTVEEVAMKYSVSQETVRRWIRTGRLKSTMSSRKSGNVISEFDLQEFLKTKSKYRNQVDTNAEELTAKELRAEIDYLHQEIAKLYMELYKLQRRTEEES